MIALAAEMTMVDLQLVAPTERVAFAALLRSHALDADARYSGSRCDDAKAELIHEERVKIGDQPHLAAERDKVRLVGCGRTHVENIAVARLGGDPPWKMVAGLPGDSLAEMPLQQSATSQVIAELVVRLIQRIP